MRIRGMVLGVALVATTLVGVGAAPAHAVTTTDVVRTLTVQTWFGGNEGPGGSVGDVTLVPGPLPVPAGAGGASLEVDSTGRASLGTLQFAGTRLDAITDLSYWGYVVGGTTNQLVLQFDVDYDSTDTNTAYQGRLTFVPSTNPPADTWRELDALSDGVWFSSQAPGNTVCNQSTYCTWAEVLAAFPDAAIRNDSVQLGAFLFRLGGPIAGGGAAYVDQLTFSANGNTKIVDFDLGGSISPTVGRPGQQVTITAYGIKPKVTVSMYYNTNSRVKKQKLCSAKASATGIAQCVGTISTNAKKHGPVGAHQVTLSARKGGYKVDYFVDFFLNP